MTDTFLYDVGNVLTLWDPKKLCRRIFPDDPRKAEIALNEGFLSPLWFEGDSGFTNMDDLAKKMALEESHYPIIKEAFHRFPDALIPIEGMVNTLKALHKKGYGVYLLSNYCEHFPRSIRNLGIEDCVDGYVYSHDVKLTKPNHEIYKLLLERYHLDPKSCLFIDDKESNVLAAKETGIGHIYQYRFDTEAYLAFLRSQGIDIEG